MLVGLCLLRLSDTSGLLLAVTLRCYVANCVVRHVAVESLSTDGASCWKLVMAGPSRPPWKERPWRHQPQQQPCKLTGVIAGFLLPQRRLLVAREGGEAAVANHPLVKHPYNAEHERNRKAALNALLGRTPQQEAEDAAVR